MSTGEAPAAPVAAEKNEERKASTGQAPAEGERPRTTSTGSAEYDETAPQRRRRQSSFSALEKGRSIVIAVDESDDAKFAFDCECCDDQLRLLNTLCDVWHTCVGKTERRCGTDEANIFDEMSQLFSRVSRTRSQGERHDRFGTLSRSSKTAHFVIQMWVHLWLP